MNDEYDDDEDERNKPRPRAEVCAEPFVPPPPSYQKLEALRSFFSTCADELRDVRMGYIIEADQDPMVMDENGTPVGSVEWAEAMAYLDLAVQAFWRGARECARLRRDRNLSGLRGAS